MLNILQNEVLARPRNSGITWSAVLVRELYRCGLRHAVISPGSRSTPLALAFALHDGIQKHVILDERAAGFFGLGIGLESGHPAVLICTSGTAVANYLPAVVEARMSRVPLIVLSADRPPFQRELGANQTIRQSGLFGDHVIFSFDTGEPVLILNDINRLSVLANQIWYSSVQQGGPVHINLPFRKPLEPESEAMAELQAYYSETSAAPYTQNNSQTSWSIPDAIISLLKVAKRPVIIAPHNSGQQNLGDITRFFLEHNLPVLGEPGCVHNHPDACETLLPGAANYLKNESIRTKLKPDLIIRVGGEPIAKGLELYLQTHSSTNLIRFESEQIWSDASLLGGTRVTVPRNAVINTPENLELDTNSITVWKHQWINHSHRWIQTRANTETMPVDFRDGDVYRTVIPFLDTQHNIMISNSFPARDAETFGAPEIYAHNVFMNRGASGIDGINSTALGIAQSSELPVVLFTGDLAYLHDTGGLANHHNLNVRFQIIVVDNGGGSIFRMLPVYKPSEWFTTYFETPQNVDLAGVAKAFGYEVSVVTTVESLKLALQKHKNHSKSIIICQTNAEASIKQRNELWQEVSLI